MPGISQFLYREDTITIQAEAPKGVDLQFAPNKGLEEVDVMFNGKAL